MLHPTLRRDPIAVALGVLGAFVVYQAIQLPMRSLDGGPGPGLLPAVLGIMLFGLGAWLVVGWNGEHPRFDNLDRVGIMALVLGVYAVGLERLGFVLTASLATTTLLLTFERRHPLLLAALGIAGAVACYALFYSVLKVQLPPDPLGLWR